MIGGTAVTLWAVIFIYLPWSTLDLSRRFVQKFRFPELVLGGLGWDPEIFTFINVIVGDSETAEGQRVHKMGVSSVKVPFSIV